MALVEPVRYGDKHQFCVYVDHVMMAPIVESSGSVNESRKAPESCNQQLGPCKINRDHQLRTRLRQLLLCMVTVQVCRLKVNQWTKHCALFDGLPPLKSLPQIIDIFLSFVFSCLLNCSLLNPFVAKGRMETK